MTCLGVGLNTLDLTLSLDSARLVEIERLLYAWLHKRTTTKSSLQSLVGKFSKCVRQSRVFIARILRLLRSVKFNHHHINLNSEFRKDLQWWRRFLRVYNGVSLISTNDWSSPGEVFTTDACLRATLKAGMMERRNGGMAESRNGGKLPQILKDGIAESRNGGKYPQTLKDGITERRNGGKYPQILKGGMTENHPKS